MTDAQRMLTAIAGFGLDDVPIGSLSMSPTRNEWIQLTGMLVTARLTGMAALLQGKGVLRLDEESTAELVELDATWSHHTLRAEDMLLAFARDLTEAGIPFRVLKGSAHAELAWRWGEARRWVDADVLVPGERIDEVVSMCIAGGATRPVPELRPGFDRRFAKSVTLKSAAGPELDLHRSLVLGPHTFLVPSSDLWSDERRFVVDDVELSTISADAALIHACMHATIGGSVRLASLRDAVEAFPHCDPDVAALLAERWRARPMVADAGTAVAERLGLDGHPFVAWARGVVPSEEERRIASVYSATNRTNRNMALASVRHISGVFDKVRYMAAVAIPSSTNRAKRGRSLGDQLRQIRPR